MSMSIVVQFGPGLQEEDANMGEHLLKNYIAGGRWSWQMVIFTCLGKNDNIFWPWQKKQEQIVLERSVRFNLDPGKGDRCDG